MTIVFFSGDESILELVMMVVQLCEYTNKRCTIHLEYISQLTISQFKKKGDLHL